MCRGCRDRLDLGACRATRLDPDGHPVTGHGRLCGDRHPEAGSGHCRDPRHCVDFDGDEKGRRKEPGCRLRRVHRQTVALPGTVCSDRHPAGPRQAASHYRIQSPASGVTMKKPLAMILIVDDEIQNRKLLEAVLRPGGYETVSVANGEEALASITQRRPDLILLDIMMPGMDGYEVAGI